MRACQGRSFSRYEAMSGLARVSSDWPYLNDLMLLGRGVAYFETVTVSEYIFTDPCVSVIAAVVHFHHKSKIRDPSNQAVCVCMCVFVSTAAPALNRCVECGHAFCTPVTCVCLCVCLCVTVHIFWVFVCA